MSDKNSFGRRTWDREEYAKQAEQRREARRSGGIVSPANPVTGISREALNFDKDLNKRQIIASSVVSTRGKSFGFYCEVCDLTFKDNLKYLDHLNSKPHLIRSGEINQERVVTLEAVKHRYESLCAKLDQQMTNEEKFDIKKRIEKRKQTEEELRRERKLKKQNKKKQKTEREGNGRNGDDVSQIMGFQGFGSTKK